MKNTIKRWRDLSTFGKAMAVIGAIPAIVVIVPTYIAIGLYCSFVVALETITGEDAK